MIKNIIFDIGGIILDDSDDNLSKVLGEDVSSLISRIHGPIFKEYLAGKIDYSSYLNYFKDDDDYEIIKKVISKDNLPITLPLLKNNYDYIKSLKDKAYNLYLLSNIFKESFEYLNTIIDIDSIFDGGVYSYQEKLLKPNKEIFELIVNRYNLNKDETIYFDDMNKNIIAGNEFGIKSILFKSIDDVKNNING